MAVILKKNQNTCEQAKTIQIHLQLTHILSSFILTNKPKSDAAEKLERHIHNYQSQTGLNNVIQNLQQYKHMRVKQLSYVYINDL